MTLEDQTLAVVTHRHLRVTKERQRGERTQMSQRRERRAGACHHEPVRRHQLEGFARVLQRSQPRRHNAVGRHGGADVGHQMTVEIANWHEARDRRQTGKCIFVVVGPERTVVARGTTRGITLDLVDLGERRVGVTREIRRADGLQVERRTASGKRAVRRDDEGFVLPTQRTPEVGIENHQPKGEARQSLRSLSRDLRQLDNLEVAIEPHAGNALRRADRHGKQRAQNPIGE